MRPASPTRAPSVWRTPEIVRRGGGAISSSDARGGDAPDLRKGRHARSARAAKRYHPPRQSSKPPREIERARIFGVAPLAAQRVQRATGRTTTRDQRAHPAPESLQARAGRSERSGARLAAASVQARVWPQRATRGVRSWRALGRDASGSDERPKGDPAPAHGARIRLWQTLRAHARLPNEAITVIDSKFFLDILPNRPF